MSEPTQQNVWENETTDLEPKTKNCKIDRTNRHAFLPSEQNLFANETELIKSAKRSSAAAFSTTQQNVLAAGGFLPQKDVEGSTGNNPAGQLGKSAQGREPIKLHPANNSAKSWKIFAAQRSVLAQLVPTWKIKICKICTIVSYIIRDFRIDIIYRGF